MITNARIVGVGCDPEEYHKQDAARGTPEYVMSASALKLFDECPSRFVAGYTPPDSDAKFHGSLLDTRLLTKEQFGKRYAIRPSTYKNEDGEEKPFNLNSKVCKSWVAEQGKKEIVSGDDVVACDQSIRRLMQDDIIASYLDASDRQVWLSGEWKDEATGLIVPLRGLVDAVPRADTVFAKTLGDIKTTRCAAASAWQRWCYQARYHVQAALYIDLYQSAVPEGDRNTFCFILSENFPPWETGKRMLSQDFLELGRASYKRTLANYCQCLKTGRFPGYDDTDESVQGWGLVACEPFMEQRDAFAPKYEFEPSEEPDEPINLN